MTNDRKPRTPDGRRVVYAVVTGMGGTDNGPIRIVPPEPVLTNARPKPVQRDEASPSASGTKRPNR